MAKKKAKITKERKSNKSFQYNIHNKLSFFRKSEINTFFIEFFIE